MGHPQNPCMTYLPGTTRSRLRLKCFSTRAPTHRGDITQGSSAFSWSTQKAKAGVLVTPPTHKYPQPAKLAASKCQLGNASTETTWHTSKMYTHYHAIWLFGLRSVVLITDTTVHTTHNLILERAQSISLENLNFYYTYCITLKIRTQRQNILNLQLYKKQNKKPIENIRAML